MNLRLFLLACCFGVSQWATSSACADEAPKLILEGPPWVVVAGSYPTDNPKNLGKAEAQLAKLREAGFAEAELIDSRVFESFACCFHTILVGRFDDKAAADERVKVIEAAGFEAFSKKGYEPRQPLPEPKAGCTQLGDAVELGGGTRVRLELCEGETQERECAEDDPEGCYDYVDTEIALARYRADGKAKGRLRLAWWEDPIYEIVELWTITSMRYGDGRAVVVALEHKYSERAVTVLTAPAKEGLELRHWAVFGSDAELTVLETGLLASEDERKWTVDSQGVETGEANTERYQGLLDWELIAPLLAPAAAPLQP